MNAIIFTIVGLVSIGCVLFVVSMLIDSKLGKLEALRVTPNLARRGRNVLLGTAVGQPLEYDDDYMMESSITSIRSLETDFNQKNKHGDVEEVEYKRAV